MIANRQQSQHSKTNYSIKSELSPKALIARWLKMTKSTQSKIPSNLPPVGL